MATCGLRLAALLLGLLGPPGPGPGTGAGAISPAELPARARVTAESIDTFGEPDEASFPLDRLNKGDEVRLVDADPASGWLTIEAPGSAFAWVDQAALRPEGAGTARVTAGQATVRVGITGARMPGPPRAGLAKGAVVQLLDRPPLQTGSGRGIVTWLAIAAPAGEVRHVRDSGLALIDKLPAEPPPEQRAAFREGAQGDTPPLPAEIATEIARIEAEHRAVLGGPIESWRLEPVRARYEALLKRATDPASTSAIQKRLDLVASHAEIARSARTIQTILERSRRRDGDVAMARQTLAEAEEPRRSPFAAEGLVQSSSRQVDGRRVFALIGKQGSPVAYLDIPPGLDTRRVLARRVGVHGSVRYDESLGSKLIAVRDIEPLE